MKKILLVLLSLLLAVSVSAQTTSRYFDGAYKYTSTFSLTANTSDTTDDQMLQICGGGGLGPSRGACVTLKGNEYATLPGDIYITSGYGGDIYLKPGNKLGWVVNYTGSDDLNELVFGGSGVANSTAYIRGARSDGSDDGVLFINGGGDASSTRGGFISLQGADVGGAGLGGDVYITAAAPAGDIFIAATGISGDIFLRSQNQTKLTLAPSTADTTDLTYGDGNPDWLTTIRSVTDDGADTSVLKITGGGAVGTTRGSTLTLYGADALTYPGYAFLASADAGWVQLSSIGGEITLITGGHSRWSVKNASGDLYALTSGNTIALQESTAADACMGTLTCNGASDVTTATTCATTGSRIFLTRTSLDADTTGDYYVKSISNGVNFVVACEVNDTGTLNWIIFHETP